MATSGLCRDAETVGRFLDMLGVIPNSVATVEAKKARLRHPAQIPQNLMLLELSGPAQNFFFILQKYFLVPNLDTARIHDDGQWLKSPLRFTAARTPISCRCPLPSASSQGKVAFKVEAIPHFPVGRVLYEVVAPFQIGDPAIRGLFGAAPAVPHKLGLDFGFGSLHPGRFREKLLLQLIKGRPDGRLERVVVRDCPAVQPLVLPPEWSFAEGATR